MSDPPSWYGAFLVELAKTCNVTKAVKAAGIERSTAYEARDRDEAFAAAWRRAKAIGAEVLEDEAVRRAHEGWEEPAIFQGRVGDSVRKFSDTLLIFLLKGAMPEKYRERQAVEHTGKDGGPIETTTLTPDEAIALMKRRREASRKGAA